MLTHTDTASLHEHTTPLGTMWSHWTDAGLYRLDWNDPSCGDASDRDSGEWDERTEDLDHRLTRFFETGEARFGEVEVDPEGWTDFNRRVYECCRQIAGGSTVTYKELAERAGNEKASRAVGAAMSRNRVLLVIPCHRVIAADGQLRGFSAAGGLETKRKLLEMEKRT